MTLGSAYPNEEIETSALTSKVAKWQMVYQNVTITGSEVREAGKSLWVIL